MCAWVIKNGDCDDITYVNMLRLEVYDVITYVTLRWSHNLRHYPCCVVRSRIEHYNHALYYKETRFVKLCPVRLAGATMKCEGMDHQRNDPASHAVPTPFPRKTCPASGGWPNQPNRWLNFTTHVEFYVWGELFMVTKDKYLLVANNQPWHQCLC